MSTYMLNGGYYCDGCGGDDGDDLTHCIDYFFRCLFTSVFVIVILLIYLVISGHI